MQARLQDSDGSAREAFEVDLLQGRLFAEDRKETLAEVAHDARNMVTALGLYCELLQEPGVLAIPYLHYGKELMLLAAASRRLADKLAVLGSRNCLLCSLRGSDPDRRPGSSEPVKQGRGPGQPKPVPPAPIVNLAAEVAANQTLLAAIAGPSIAVRVAAESGACAVQITSEDLTRILVNMVRNAADAMPAGGAIELTLSEKQASAGEPGTISLSIKDSGPGIAASDMERIFDAGFSTHSLSRGDPGPPDTHRGLGLSIARSIVEAAGGRMEVARGEPGGARFLIELPIRTGPETNAARAC